MSSKVKPIVVIYFPNLFESGGERNWIYKFMAHLNGKPSNENNVKWVGENGYWKDYYWFCFYKEDITEPELKVFYEKDFTPIQFEGLKKLIEDSIQEIKLKSND